MNSPAAEARAKVIDKIKKCLAKADPTRNDSEAEVSLALETAHRLLRDNQMSMADIEFDMETGMAKQPVVEGLASQEFKQFKKWEYYSPWLCYVLCDVTPYFNCEETLYPGIRSIRRSVKKRIVFVGMENDVAMAIEIYKMLRKSIMRLAREKGVHLEGNAAYEAYCTGVCLNLIARAKKMKAEEKQESENNSKDLVVLKGALVKTYLDKKNMGEMEFIKTDTQNPHYFKGLRDGQQISLNFKKSLK